MISGFLVFDHRQNLVRLELHHNYLICLGGASEIYVPSRTVSGFDVHMYLDPYLSGGGRDVLVNFEITGALDMELWLRQTYYVNRRLTDNIHRT